MDEKAPSKDKDRTPSKVEVEEHQHEGVDINRLLADVRAALEKFQGESTPENFAKVVTSLGAIGLSSAKVWDEAANYTKKHPLVVALGAGVLFFAFKGLFHSRKASLAGETYH